MGRVEFNESTRSASGLSGTSFIIFQSGERVTSFTKDNNANFSSKKW